MPSRPKFGGGARDGATDFLQLSIAYAKQEALQPIVRQVRALGKGILGSVVLALGTVLLALGFVRALQNEFGGAETQVAGQYGYAPLTRSVHVGKQYPYGVTGHLSGSWSWVPYVGGALLCLLVAVFCVTRVLSGRKP